MQQIKVPFNRPKLTGRELEYMAEVLSSGHLAGDGTFTKRCHSMLEAATGAKKALLTQSCTGALEMAALLLELQPGDEIIMPSFTFVSTASAFGLRGAVPVFVDIREDTLNLDENLIEAAITPRTKAICVVHYAGVACEMDRICQIADAHGLVVVEDAAQAAYSTFHGRPLGCIGQLGCLSFHETKNIVSGEGGALLIRDAEFVEKAEIVREKGTNRSRFLRGQVDKYTWIALGSSYLPSDLIAAFLAAQLEAGPELIAGRRIAWDRYHAWAAGHESKGWLRRPIVPAHCGHNAHMYYLLLPSLELRGAFIEGMRERGITTAFHYVPLHSSPQGARCSRTASTMAVTNSSSERLVRLPLWADLGSAQDVVLQAADEVLERLS